MDCPSHGRSVKMFHNQGSPTSHRLSTGRSTLHASSLPGSRGDITSRRIVMLVIVILVMVMQALSSQQVLQTARVSVSTSSRFNTSSTWWLLNHRVCRSCKICNVYRLFTDHCNIRTTNCCYQFSTTCGLPFPHNKVFSYIIWCNSAQSKQLTIHPRVFLLQKNLWKLCLIGCFYPSSFHKSMHWPDAWFSWPVNPQQQHKAAAQKLLRATFSLPQITSSQAL